jgi:hypothetical protein
MGPQSFTKQGTLPEEVETPDTAPDAAALPSFRPVAPRAAKASADQRSSPIPEPATKPPVDKKHFIARDGQRASQLAPSQSPSLVARPIATAAERPLGKTRAGLIRSALILALGAVLGYLSSSVLPGPAHLTREEVARAPADQTSAEDLSTLVDKAGRQIAEGRLETPAGDNALETYRRIALRSPASLETRSVGEHLSLAFWSLGAAATQRGDWAEATRYFDITKTLPVPRTAPVATGLPSPEHAPDVEKLPAAVATGDAAALANVPSFPAAAKGPVAGTAAEVALRRGDEAMRLGDIVSARRFYEFAASAGIAAAATAVGQTYDPLYLKSVGVRGVRANPETARGWYEKAARQGDVRAAQLLQLLDQK